MSRMAHLKTNCETNLAGVTNSADIVPEFLLSQILLGGQRPLFDPVWKTDANN